MARRADWSPGNLKKAAAVLGRSQSIAGALPEIQRIVGNARVTEGTLKAAFAFRSMRTPRTYLAAAPEAAPDPLAAREAKDLAERERRRQAALLDELAELRARVAFVDRVSAAAEPPRIVGRESDHRLREMTPVVLASDWHVEEVVDPAAVAGRNKYDLEIASDRVERFFRAVIWNVEHQRASGLISIRDLVLWLGGDLMTGYIHEELAESNQLSPTETILWLLPRLEGGIRALLDQLKLERLVVPCSFGNHGRTTPKPRVSTGYANSFEWLMYHALADRFRGDARARFEITPSAHQYVQVYDQTVHFHHGDEVRYQGGVGGIGIPLLKAVPQWDLVRRADVHCIGHWHMLRDLGRAVVNGSLIGFGPYSQKIRAEFEPPQQAMFYLDSRRGKTMLTHLWVAEREGEEK